MTPQDPNNKVKSTDSTNTIGGVDYDILGVSICSPEESQELIYNPFCDFLIGDQK